MRLLIYLPLLRCLDSHGISSLSMRMVMRVCVEPLPLQALFFLMLLLFVIAVFLTIGCLQIKAVY